MKPGSQADARPLMPGLMGGGRGIGQRIFHGLKAGYGPKAQTAFGCWILIGACPDSRVPGCSIPLPRASYRARR